MKHSYFVNTSLGIKVTFINKYFPIPPDDMGSL